MKQILCAAISDFRASWKTLAITDIFYKFIAFLVLSSTVGIAFRTMLSLSGRVVLVDEDILYFLLEPIGWISVIIVGVLSLGILAFEQAALMGVLQAQTQNRNMNYVGAVQFALANAKVVLQLAIRLMLALLLIAAPFMLATGIIYFTLLTQYDINYYLTVHPPEFISALAFEAILLIGFTFLLLRLISAWFFSLPLVLFENISPAKALSISSERTRSYRFKLFKWIACWVLSLLSLSAIFSFLVIGVGRLIVPEVKGSLPLLVLTIGLILLFWLLTNLLITLLSTTSFAVMLFNLYRHYGMQDPQNITQLGHEKHTLTQLHFQLTKKTLLLGATLGIVLSTVVGLIVTVGVQFDNHAEIIAHRGASASAPENTMAAVKQAIIDQADWVEIDAQETAEGEVVVFHDSDFMKLANIDLKIWDATQKDLAQIDIGSHFDKRFNAERVPTLRQVLATAKGKIKVIIELKYYGHDQHLEQRVAEIVEAEEMQSNIIMMSLKSDKVKKMKELRPKWQVGLLTSAAFGKLSNAKADFLAVNLGLANHHFIDSAHKKGKQVFVWTVNDAPTMSKLIGRGVDGLITDKPAVARMVIQHRTDMPAIGRLILELAELLGATPEINDQ